MTRKDTKQSQAAQIIESFRASTPTPSEEEWMTLIEAHPSQASKIADTALVELAAEHLEEADLEASLDQDAFEAGVSQAISRLYEVPSDTLRKAQENIGAVQGTAVRALAREAGLGSASSLLSGVLIGAITAPRALVTFLATKWDSPGWVLLECFHRARAGATVPAFKAEFGKPGIAVEPRPWAEAVRSLKLPDSETQHLLKLQD